jgi:NADPH:quinone reductase
MLSETIPGGAATMLALAVSQAGGPEVLKLTKVPRPKPGPGQILIRNHAVGVNYVETMIRAGTLPPAFMPSLPYIPGREGAGVVAAHGEGVVSPPVGTRVMWMNYIYDGGGYAEYVVVRAYCAVPIADGVPFEKAAGAPIVYVAARRFLFEHSRLEPGDWILVRAAAGAAGIAMIETAAAAALRPIAVASGTKLDRARVYGAVATIDYQHDSVVERVRAITDGAGIALALNPVAGDTVIEDLGLLAPYGQVILYGLLQGLPTGDVGGALMRRMTDGIGLRMGEINKLLLNDPTRMRSLLEQIASDLAEGRVNLPIFETVPFADGARTHALIESGRTIGKVVIALPN